MRQKLIQTDIPLRLSNIATEPLWNTSGLALVIKDLYSKELPGPHGDNTTFTHIEHRSGNMMDMHLFEHKKTGLRFFIKGVKWNSRNTYESDQIEKQELIEKLRQIKPKGIIPFLWTGTLKNRNLKFNKENQIEPVVAYAELDISSMGYISLEDFLDEQDDYEKWKAFELETISNYEKLLARYRISHGHIHDGNILIHPKTMDIILIDAKYIKRNA